MRAATVGAFGAVTLLVMAGCGDDSDAPSLTGSSIPGSTALTTPTTPATAPASSIESTMPPADHALFGPVWWLTEAVVDGASLELPTHLNARTRFQFLDDVDVPTCSECPPGPKLVGNDSCNDFAASAQIEDDEVSVVQWGESTMQACEGPLIDAMDRVLRGGFTYTVVDDELLVESSASTITMTFSTSSDPFGETSDEVVAEGTIGTIAYRFTWEGDGGVLELRDQTAGYQRNAVGIGSGESGVDAVQRPLDDGRGLIAGAVPANTSHAQYQPEQGSPVDLELIEVQSQGALAFAQVVDHIAEHWTVVAYDDTGAELSRYSF